MATEGPQDPSSRVLSCPNTSNSNQTVSSLGRQTGEKINCYVNILQRAFNPD